MKRNRRGQTLVVVALLAGVLVGFASLAIDQSRAMADRRDLQVQTDFAALAGGRTLAGSSSADAANFVTMQYLATSLGFPSPSAGTPATGQGGTPSCSGSATCPGGSYLVGGGGAYTITLTNGSGRLDLSVQHTQAPVFGRVLGFSSEVVGASARAALPSGCAVCVFGSGSKVFQSQGNVTVTGGGVVISSSASDAVDVTAGTVNATTSIVGGLTPGSASHFNPAPTTGASPALDPLASLPLPPSSPPPTNYGQVQVQSAGTVTLNPGLYDTIFSRDASIVLNPGIYVITNNMEARGTGGISGSNVLLYFTCNTWPTPCAPGTSGGQLQLHESAVFNVSAATPATCSSSTVPCTFAGLAIYFDRNNNRIWETEIPTTVTGAIYMASSGFDCDTSCTLSLDSAIDVRAFEIESAGAMTDNYQATDNIAGFQAVSPASLSR